MNFIRPLYFIIKILMTAEKCKKKKTKKKKKTTTTKKKQSTFPPDPQPFSMNVFSDFFALSLF